MQLKLKPILENVKGTIVQPGMMENVNCVKKNNDGLIDPNSKTGWLAPSGDWYGCGNGNHQEIAYELLHLKERELELAGWIKIWYAPYAASLYPTNPYDWYCESEHITKAQKDFLLSRNLLRGWD